VEKMSTARQAKADQVTDDRRRTTDEVTKDDMKDVPQYRA
jgi:hypothetical protein